MDYFDKHLFSQPQIPDPPPDHLQLIVTIPCYNEEGLLKTLQSLEACIRPEGNYEVILHFNAPENSPPAVIDQNQKTMDEFISWRADRKNFHLIHSPALPEKHAGVGLARKIAMDEAAWRLVKSGNEKGVIVCLDADCEVGQTYLSQIEKHFQKNPSLTGCSISFSHPLEGKEFDANIYESIINYELFLRYYILTLKWTRFPYAWHTIGSSMAVRADAYMKQGGMNRRKAGEDFYFLHKLFPLGEFSTLNSTRVIPSPRISDRVPFGTGADIAKQLSKPDEHYSTYNLSSFADLKKFFQLIPQFYYQRKIAESSLPETLKSFLMQDPFEEKLREIKAHTSSESSFTKRFFTWFDGFKVLKFVHFARDNFYPNEEITLSVTRLLRAIDINEIPSGKKEMLLMMRKIEAKSES